MGRRAELNSKAVNFREALRLSEEQVSSFCEISAPETRTTDFYKVSVIKDPPLDIETNCHSIARNWQQMSSLMTCPRFSDLSEMQRHKNDCRGRKLGKAVSLDRQDNEQFEVGFNIFTQSSGMKG